VVGLWTAQLGYKIVTGRIRHERGGGGETGHGDIIQRSSLLDMYRRLQYRRLQYRRLAASSLSGQI